MSTQCLACQRKDQPGRTVTGESAYGLPLAPFHLCNACVARGFSQETCARCKLAETPELRGNVFTVTHSVGPLFLHNACAPLAGTPQGVTQTYLDDLAKQNG
ncbi:MAG: hypothetical protein JWM80_5150 [Cyanobacteria bacterium RYN_339]|nr:hypothetical protein [Cyanobacteria bacterium RYN_339]